MPVSSRPLHAAYKHKGLSRHKASPESRTTFQGHLLARTVMFPNPLDAVIDPLCKTDESRKLAKAYFKLIRSLRPGEGTNNLPPGIAFICAWIANVRYVASVSTALLAHSSVI